MTAEVKTTKVCRRCKIEKPLEDFPTNNAMKDKKDGMCKPCWSIYQKEKRARAEARVAEGGTQGVVAPKRGRKVAVPADNSGASEDSSASAEEVSHTGDTEEVIVGEVDPKTIVPTITTEMYEGHEIDVIHHPTAPVLEAKTWHRGFVGPFADVVKFFTDIFGHIPDKVVKHKSTYYFPISDDEFNKTRKTFNK